MLVIVLAVEFRRILLLTLGEKVRGKEAHTYPGKRVSLLIERRKQKTKKLYNTIPKRTPN